MDVENILNSKNDNIKIYSTIDAKDITEEKQELLTKANEMLEQSNELTLKAEELIKSAKQL